MKKSNTAIFIDYDNIQITASKLSLKHCYESQLWTTPLITEIENFTGGSVDIRKCYGDVMLNTGLILKNRVYNPKDMRSLIDVDVNLQYDLIRNGFQMIHTPAFSGKNRADILMALDCIEIALKHDQVDTFAILTQDSDFTPLFDKLRAAGKRVILVTVSESDKKSKSNQTLLSLVNQHIVYNQEIIDKYGYDLLKSVLTEIEVEEPEALNEGINLSSINTRMLKKSDEFNFMNLGYSRFKDFIEDCLTDGYELAANVVKKQQIIETTVARLESDKITQISTTLRKQGIRLNYSLILKIRNHTLENNDSWNETATFGDLTEMHLENFTDKGFSKNQIRDAIKMLQMSGFLSTLGDEELPLKQKRCAIFSEIDLDGSLAYLAIDRIFQAGFTVTENDIKDVTVFIFEEAKQQYQTIVKESVSILKHETEK